MTPEDLKTKFLTAAKTKAAVPVPFPASGDVLLSRHREPVSTEDIDKFFLEYFKVGAHQIFPNVSTIGIHKPETTDGSFLKCLSFRGGFPPESCLPASCIKLDGNRGTFSGVSLTRLFAGDLVWLFYFERMGVFKMLGAVLDDFVTKGKYPLPNDNLDALILEVMARQTKTGLSSTVRDRDSTYRRCLGWTSDVGRKLGSSAKVNAGFNNHFHKFLGLALTWYNDRRLAQAIQSTNTMRKSVATLIAISKTLKDLKHSFDEFKYGRNYAHTLSGIVWCVSGLTLIRDLRGALGIPGSLTSPSDIVPAAYDLLVKGMAAGTTDQSHYSQHIECASSGRDILIDLEFLNESDTSDGLVPTSPAPDPRGELTLWLDEAEAKIERYRTAYQGLTGVDLGAPGSPTIEQQA